jgi:DNA replication and repair protein RecF
VGTLLAAAGDYYQRLAGEPAHFSYWSSTGRLDDVLGALRAGLAATRERSFMLRHTLVGPHRDDIRIRRGERDLRRFGSVGEQRLAGIALRLAEADMILSSGQQRPVFLLDEVASELDERRAGMVFDLVRERGQMVYAAARRIPPQQVKAQSADMGQAAEGSSGGDPAACRDAVASPEHPWAKEFGVDAGTVQKVS